jgi:hypothetical protein
MQIVTASELPRHILCPGHVHLSNTVEPQPSDVTIREEGNAVHWLASEVFHGRISAAEMIDRRAPNGIYIDNQMADHVADYLSALNCGEMEVDTSFASPAGHWQVNARADHRVYEAATNTLTIDDLKYGYRIVDPVENWTLIAHAVGSCIALGIAPARIVLRIHQPRAYHPDGPLREWVIDYTTLLAAHTRIDRTLSVPSDQLVTGPVQCIASKCPKRYVCPAYRMSGMNAIDATSFAFDDKLSGEELADRYQLLSYARSVIENNFDAVEQLIAHRINSNDVVPGYTVEPRYGNRAFTAGLTPEILMALTGKNLAAPAKVISPAAAERAGVPKAVVETLTKRPIIGHKVTKFNPEKHMKGVR